MFKVMKTGAWFALCVLLQGCSSAAQEAERARLLSISEFNQAAHSQLQRLSDEQAAANVYVIYFASGSSAPPEESEAGLKFVAQLLIDNPSVQLTVEGHTDNAGGFQDNIVLGEARARAIRARLVELGVLVGQVQVVSYADLYPVQLGDDEAAYRLNRRAVLEFEGLRG
ncbi:OmpA family protein [Pseudomonas tolaasii]|uniref:OmpA family protein n=2 Tax=Pseudomonas tolaasii TaxID=29442 RepID=A0A7Y8AUT2_PSETO|nr:OmpA family protein [Pseudomonas tolaasii]ARB27436.1 peptidoglycan-binding protein [Pseudomonas tolaasii]KAB0467459.1 OmpA family protein [Pseudomonas tolaasii]MBY8943334.1 OmpA family protein [Pseudomonas tolaasii]NWC21758.1 OmpA family protein [Pseudomonas tolaasii]NWC29908.1 OmpA family protein [Pseudomonas tolaasii]